MNRRSATLGGFGLLLALGGCNPMADLETKPTRTPPEARRPAEPAPPPAPEPAPPPAPAPTSTASKGGFEIKWDTARDRTYAEFLRDHSGGMLRGARVGVERKGLVEVKLDKSVPPDDTADLTRSLVKGIRKDFPDKKFRLKVYDPNGKAILTAHVDPNEGVDYQLAHNAKERTQSAADEPDRPTESASASEASPKGETEKDREFARWALDHGKAYLRYVEADLEQSGRLWFGVTRQVKPADVKGLTKSLLEGAQKAFPRRDLSATVFDPNGERIGRAQLSRDGSIRWVE